MALPSLPASLFYPLLPSPSPPLPPTIPPALPLSPAVPAAWDGSGSTASHASAGGVLGAPCCSSAALEMVWAVAGGTGDSLRQSLAAVLASSSSSSSAAAASSHAAAVPGVDEVAALADCREALEVWVAAARGGGRGLLAAGLADGVAGVLDTLTDALVRAEADLLADAGLGPAFVRSRLQPFAVALPAVAALVEDVTARGLRGGALINALYARCAAAGDAALQAHFSALLTAVHRPWFSLLAQWCGYGELPDAPGEFLVAPAAGGVGLRTAWHPAGGAGTQAASSPGDSPPAAGGVPLPQLAAEHDWFCGAALVREHIPTLYCADPVADDILLIGAAVRLLRAPGRAMLPAGDAGGVLDDGAGASEEHAGTDDDEDGGGGVDGGGSSELPASSGAAVAAAAHGVPARLSEADCLRIARYVGTLRDGTGAPFSPLTFEYVIAQVKAFVLRRLWALVVRRGDYFVHAAAMRDYLLLGRGDLYRAFVEAARSLLSATPAVSPAAPALLTAGPWRAAAAVAAIPTPDDTSGDGPAAAAAAGSPFARCFWTLYHAAVRWWPPSPTLVAGLLGDEPGGAPDVAVGGAAGSGGAALRALTAWLPPGVAAEALARAPHAAGAMLAVGSAGILAVQVQHGGGGAPMPPVSPDRNRTAGGGVGGSGSPAHAALSEGGGGTTGGSSDALWEHACLMLSLPAGGGAAAEAARHPTPAPAGAVWYHQPLLAARGFLARAALHLHIPLFPSDADGASHTVSFAAVLQRSTAMSAGACASPAARRAAPVPPSGADDLPAAVVLHILAKRLRTNLASVGRADGGSAGALAGGGTPTTTTFRLVAALYGPLRPGDAAAGRPLLASGVVPELTLPLLHTYLAPSDGTVTAVFPLCLAWECTPPPAAPAGDAGVAGAAPAARRLVVSVLQPAAASTSAVAAAAGARRASAASTGSTGTGGVAGDTHTLIDAAVNLASVLDFGSWRGPGRDRAWFGFTADGVHAERGAPATSLAGLDFTSYSDADAGYRGLTLGYAVPWPVHVVVTASAVALLQDIFRLLLRTKTASLALQDTWRTLMDSFSLSASTGAGIVVTPDAPLRGGGGGAGGGGAAGAGGAGAGGDGMMRRSRRGSARSDRAPSVDGSGDASDGSVAGRVSGVGGKRSRDPAVYARQRLRIAVHKLLQPVWLLRSQMAAVVDAVLYHMQVDVIEAAWARMATAAAAAPDFPALVRAHDAYTTDLRTGCFIGQASVLACMERLLQGVDAFTALVAATAPNLAALLQPSGGRATFTSIAAAFKTDTRLLIGLLAGAAHIAEASSLVTRLNFSGYFGDAAL